MVPSIQFIWPVIISAQSTLFIMTQKTVWEHLLLHGTER